MKINQRQFNQKTIIIWRFTDGKIGHEKQSAALTFELGKLIPVKVFEFNANTSEILKYLLLGRSKISKYKNANKPDIILGAGHRTHLPILWAKLLFGGKSVVIMKPSLPYSIFDLCVVPHHDNPPKKQNIIPTMGALNLVNHREQVIPKANSVFFLIGGPSSHFKWEDKNIISQIEKILVTNDYQYSEIILTSSRRTPESFLKSLREKQITNMKICTHNETPVGWLEDTLCNSEIAWATPDSISMVYEALSANCKVGVFDLEETSKNDKVARNISLLKKEKYILTFDMFASDESLSVRKFGNQAEICAHEVKEKIFQDIKVS